MSELVSTVLPSVGLSFRSGVVHAYAYEAVGTGQVVEFDLSLTAATTNRPGERDSGMALAVAPGFAGTFYGRPCAVALGPIPSGELGRFSMFGIVKALVDSSAGALAAETDLYVGWSGALVPGPQSGKYQRAILLEAVAASETPTLAWVLFAGDVGFGTDYHPIPAAPVAVGTDVFVRVLDVVSDDPQDDFSVDTGALDRYTGGGGGGGPGGTPGGTVGNGGEGGSCSQELKTCASTVLADTGSGGIQVLFFPSGGKGGVEMYG